MGMEWASRQCERLQHGATGHTVSRHRGCPLACISCSTPTGHCLRPSLLTLQRKQQASNTAHCSPVQRVNSALKPWHELSWREHMLHTQTHVSNVELAGRMLSIRGIWLLQNGMQCFQPSHRTLH